MNIEKSEVCPGQCKNISNLLSPCVLLSGFLYALLSLSDQLLLSFALIFASVLHDFISLAKWNIRLHKKTLKQLSKHKQRGRGTGNSIKGHLFFLMALYLRLDLLKQCTSRLIVVQFTGCGEVLGCLLPVTQQPREAGRHTTSLSEYKGFHYKHQPLIWRISTVRQCAFTEMRLFEFCQLFA